jgi:acetyl esterase/lipase
MEWLALSVDGGVVSDRVRSAAVQPENLPVWPGDAPGSEAWRQIEAETTAPWGPDRLVRNVVRPTLEPFLPERPSGLGAIVCPGGGFHFHSIDKEGTDVARWLRDHGVAAFVLRYRLRETPVDDAGFRTVIGELMVRRAQMEAVRPLGVADAVQALSVVRARAGELGVEPARLGLIGFSAGGMVATAAAVDPDPSRRPAFAGVIYGAPWETPPVPLDAPPLFQAVAADDFLVDHCIELHRAWIWSERSSELHVYAKGGHGFGMNKRGLPIDGWLDRLWGWFAGEGLR